MSKTVENRSMIFYSKDKVARRTVVNPSIPYKKTISKRYKRVVRKNSILWYLIAFFTAMSFVWKRASSFFELLEDDSFRISHPVMWWGVQLFSGILLFGFIVAMFFIAAIMDPIMLDDFWVK